MKIVTYHSASGVADRYRLGVKHDDVNIEELGSREFSSAELLEWFDLEKGHLASWKDLKLEHYGEPMDVAGLRLAPPVPRPGKVICIGLNYRDHAEEANMPIPESPIIFSKFQTCVVASGDAIEIPEGSAKVDYEAELAFIIGRTAKNVSAKNAMHHVFGYTNFNDVSARDFQFADGQWQRGKSCDTFAPMGPFIATADEIADPHDLGIRFRLNGEILQNSNMGQLIFGVSELIEFLSRSITLEPGDVVATGTPPGVGFARKPPIFMKDGDIAEVEIDGLGILSNPVVSNVRTQ